MAQMPANIQVQVHHTLGDLDAGHTLWEADAQLGWLTLHQAACPDSTPLLWPGQLRWWSALMLGPTQVTTNADREETSLIPGKAPDPECGVDRAGWRPGLVSSQAAEAL